MKKDESVDKESQTAKASKNAYIGAIHQWKIRETLSKWWNFIKNPDFTNPAISIATIVIACTTVATWWEAHSSSTQTDKIIAADERIACAMENAVAQANASLTETANQFRLDQRAWVGPIEVIKPAFVPTSSFSIKTVIGNSGKTPAVNFKNKYSWNIILKKGKFQAVYKDIQGVPSSDTIFPGQKLTLISTPIPLQREYLDLILQDKAVLYLYGELAYEDVFHQTHYTHFCTFYDKTLMGGVCDTYNDTN